MVINLINGASIFLGHDKHLRLSLNIISYKTSPHISDEPKKVHKNLFVIRENIIFASWNPKIYDIKRRPLT